MHKNSTVATKGGTVDLSMNISKYSSTASHVSIYELIFTKIRIYSENGMLTSFKCQNSIHV